MNSQSYIATFIDLFLMAFIATLILNAVSPKGEEIKELKFDISYSNDKNLELVPLVLIKFDDQIIFSTDEVDGFNWRLSSSSIGCTIKSSIESELEITFLISDDFGKLGGIPVKYNFTSSKGVYLDGEISSNDYYLFQAEIKL